jgi:hypothetical protein
VLILFTFHLQMWRRIHRATKMSGVTQSRKFSRHSSTKTCQRFFWGLPIGVSLYKLAYPTNPVWDRKAAAHGCVMEATRGPVGVSAHVAVCRGTVLPAWPAGPEASEMETSAPEPTNVYSRRPVLICLRWARSRRLVSRHRLYPAWSMRRPLQVGPLRVAYALASRCSPVQHCHPSDRNQRKDVQLCAPIRRRYRPTRPRSPL